MRLKSAARAVAGIMLASLVTVVAAPAAHADELPNYEPSKTVTLSSWAYVDSATPTAGHPGGDGEAPVGATAEGAVRRSYFAYDTAAFAGKHILGATLAARETSATDCGYRAVEVWVTEAFGPTSSWQNLPGAQFRAATAGLPASGCEVADARFDVTSALTKAAVKGWEKVTFELRVPAAKQADPRYARQFAGDPKLIVRYNTRPLKPINVSTNGVGCAASSPGTYVTATFADLYADQPDDDGYPDEKRARWAIWPVHDAAARQESLGGSITWLTASLSTMYADIELVDGRSYGWQVRTEDGTDVSPWSKTCYFTVDATPPAVPVITSTTFPDPAVPSGGVGLPATFNLDAQGDYDTVAFQFGGRTVKADQPGGKATITYTPESPYEHWLPARAIDRAGNPSDEATIHIYVKESRPQVESALYTPWGPGGGIGVPGEFLFTPAEPGATRFQYQLNDDASVSVKAAVEGPTAVPITPQRGGQNTLRVRSRDVAGVFSSWRTYEFQVDTAPKVTIKTDGELIVGRPVTVDVEPGMPGVVSYEYWLSYGAEAERHTLDADESGKASFTWLPSLESSELHIRSRTASGAWSATADPYAFVRLAQPEVTGGAENAKPGQTLSWTARSEMPEVTEYVWSVTGDDEQHVLPAAADGSSTFSWKVPADGNYTISVFARNATGARTLGEWLTTLVYSAPLVSSDIYPEWYSGGGVGIEGTFTIRPNLPDVAEYTYSFSTFRKPGQEQTVPANPDGTVTLKFTPTETYRHTLKIQAKTATGIRSGQKSYDFTVN